VPQLDAKVWSVEVLVTGEPKEVLFGFARDSARVRVEFEGGAREAYIRSITDEAKQLKPLGLQEAFGSAHQADFERVVSAVLNKQASFADGQTYYVHTIDMENVIQTLGIGAK